MEKPLSETLVYVAPEVAEADALHPYVRETGFRAQTIRAQLARQAEVVHQAYSCGDQRLRMQVMCWWPGARGKTLEDVLAGTFTPEDARATVALEHGFENWGAVDDLGDACLSRPFECALDEMLVGDHDAFKERLVATPSLATARSAYGHRATLLHYLGANGVESHRQRTPRNAVQLAATLIAMGADSGAHAHMYGGGQTAHALATTSAHPHNAGVADELAQILQPRVCGAT